MTVSFDASEINNWSDTDSSSTRLPELVRKLVLATLPEFPKRIHMPSGSSVRLSGWDGFLEVGQGNAWVPDGVSGWEFSCEKGVTSKANRDYGKRTADSLGLDKATTTFVFATPRRWAGKLEWEWNHRAEGLWRDVRALDADDLVVWLEQSPEVTNWFAEMVGKWSQSYEILERIEDRQIESRSEVVSGLSDLNEQVKYLSDSIVAPGAEVELDQEYQKLSTKIDSARDLVRKGLVEVARSQLQELLEGTDDLPDDLKFRIITNLAVCALGSERIDEACALFDQAYGIQPDNPAAMANAATGALLQNTPERALELSQMARSSSEPHDSSVTATYIRSLWGVGQGERIDELVESEKWISEDSKVAFALAAVRVQQERFEEATELYRDLVQADPEDAEAHLAFSQCLLSYAQTVGGYGDEWLVRLREAETAASQAVSILRDTQLKARYLEARVVHAVAYLQLGDTDRAIRELDTVLDEKPSHPDAAFNKGVLLLREGQPAEARNLLEVIQDPERKADAILPLSEAYLLSGDAPTAVHLLEGSLNFEFPRWEDARLAGLLLQVEAEVGAGDSVGPALDAALEQNPDDPRLLVIEAARSQLLQDPKRAEGMLIKAIERAEEPNREEIQFQLATFYESQERFDEAADLFREVAGGSVFHPAAIPHLMCLHKSGRKLEALSLARRIHSTFGQAPRVAVEVEAQILEQVGDIPAVARLLEEMCSRSDSTPLDQASLAMAEFRSGNRDKALETVQGIDVSDLRSDPQALMKLALMKRFLGSSDYLEDAYLARRYGPNDAGAQLGYFRLFQGVDKDWEVPATVGPGCAVRVKIGGEEQWWHILESGEKRLGSRELSMEDDLAIRLIGRSVGDTVVSRQFLQDQSYEITAIQSKYVRAYQEITEEFPTRFPDNTSLSRITLDDNFTEVFQAIELRDQLVRNAESLYRSAGIPFATFCSIIGRSAIEVWPEYTVQPSSILLFGTSTEVEAEMSSDLLSGADGIVLDMIALLTVHKLGLAEQLSNRYSRTVIPQKVFEEIQSVVYTMRMDSAPIGTMGKDEEGRYTQTDIPENVWEQRLEYVSSVLALAESFQRVASYPILDAGDPERLVDTLTDAGVGAVYAGDESPTAKLVLVSDDLVQSTVSRYLEIGTVNTQALLLELLRSEVITDEQYSEWVEQLALMNYWFVRVRPQDILRSLESNGYQTTEGARAMLGTLRGPDCPEDYAAMVGAEVVASLVKEPLLWQQLELILSLVLMDIRRGRQTNLALLKFKGEISVRLKLAPLECERILRLVDIYMQT